VVVSGLPNITPIFMRIWLMKMIAVWDLEVMAVSFECLGHEPGLEAHVAVAHFAFDFGFRGEGGDGVDDDDIDGAGAHEGFGDIERLFAVIRWEMRRLLRSTPSAWA